MKKNNSDIRIILLFFTFLKKKKLYVNFMNGIKGYYVNGEPQNPIAYNIYLVLKQQKNESSRNLLSNSFAWSDTKEGYEFWKSISEEWRMKLTKYNLHNSNANDLIIKDIMYEIIK